MFRYYKEMSGLFVSVHFVSPGLHHHRWHNDQTILFFTGLIFIVHQRGAKRAGTKEREEQFDLSLPSNPNYLRGSK